MIFQGKEMIFLGNKYEKVWKSMKKNEKGWKSMKKNEKE